jgi:hypothetical protein
MLSYYINLFFLGGGDHNMRKFYSDLHETQKGRPTKVPYSSTVRGSWILAPELTAQGTPLQASQDPDAGVALFAQFVQRNSF